MYGKEGINALYYFWKKISANAQISIDEFIRTLIKGLGKADIKGLPKTTLTEYELNQINVIMQYKIGDLWDRVARNDPNLTNSERKQVSLAGRELIGASNENYQALYSFVDPALNDEEQAEIDRKAR